MNIIYEDKDILVIDKPAGLAVQTRSVGEKDVESEIKKLRRSKGEPAEIYVVHRLDKPVSGLMVLAKNKDAAAVLSKEMGSDDFLKIYKARVLKPKDFIRREKLTDYLVKDAKTNTSHVASLDEKGAKKAVLSYETLNEDESLAELLIKLETGRHHQIRLQLSHAGMPILGDLKYGTEESKRVSSMLNIYTVSLRAVELSFKHPVTHKELHFTID